MTRTQQISEDLARQAAQLQNDQRNDRIIRRAKENWLDDGERLEILELIKHNGDFRAALGHAMYHGFNGELCTIMKEALNKAAYENAEAVE